MNWLVLAGSLVAILALAGIAHALRLGRDMKIGSPQEAAAAAETALAGFEAANVVVGADGAGALAVGEDGRLAAIKRHGARPAVREVRWSSVRSTPAGTVIETGERRFGPVTLVGVNVLHLKRLTAPSRDAEVARGEAA